MALNPELISSLAAWRRGKLARRSNADTVVSRCRRTLLSLTVFGELTTWRDVRPDIVDNYITERLDVVKADTVARDVAALREWLEWNEERELSGPVRSQYLRGRIVEKRQANRFALTDTQAEWLLQRAWWVQRGQKSLKFLCPSSGRRKSAWCAHWEPGGFHLFTRFGLELGLRPRELFWLAWEDFNETDSGLVLSVQDHGHEGRAINEVKAGRHSRRQLVVPDGLRAELETWRDDREKDGSLRRFLFAWPRPDKREGWIKPEISFIFKALKEELPNADGTVGDKRLVCNTLRKTCGQRLRRKGLDYFAIAQFLGHSATTCMRYYVEDCREDEAFDAVTCAPVRLWQSG
jgi:integrase